MRKTLAFAAIVFSFPLLPCGPAAGDQGQQKPPVSSQETAIRPQTRCPVMGGEIDRNIYVDVKGKRIYVCCRGCDDAIRAEPDIYIKKMRDKGIAVADTPR